MLHRIFLLITLFAVLLTFSACGEAEDDEPIAFPPTPEAGEAVIEPTTAFYEPAAQSPDELGTPGVGEVETMDTAEELVGEDDGAFVLDEEPSTEDIFGIYIPVPEEAELIEVEVDDNEELERYSKASYAVDGTTVEEVKEYYLVALPEAGFTVDEGDLGSDEDAETIRFTTDIVEKSGLISLVDTEEAVRITISTASIDE